MNETQTLKTLNTEWLAFKGDQLKRLQSLEHNATDMQAQLDELNNKTQRRPVATEEQFEGAEQAKAFLNFLRTGDRDYRLKAMSIGSDPEGGYAVPASLAAEIARVAQAYSPMRQLANVVKSTKGHYQQLVSTGLAGAEWRAELDTRNETAMPQFAAITPPHGELSSVAPVTSWLAQDSEFDLAKFVAEEIGKAHGVTEGAAFITGTGLNRPKGILTSDLSTAGDDSRPFGALQKMNSGAAGVVVADKLIDLLYSLKPEYRAKASWLMNPTTLAAVRKLKASGSGDYLWEPSAQVGQPSTLLGVPVFEDANMPALAADANAVLVGDFRRGYTVLDVGQPVLLRDDLTAKGKVLFYVAKRVGGSVVDSNALKVLTLSA